MESVFRLAREEQMPFAGQDFKEVQCDSLEDRVFQAKEVIKDLFVKGHPAVVAFSGGKDASSVACLVLAAARELVEADHHGVDPLVVVTTSDTMIENPEVQSLYTSELRKMSRYADKHRFRLIVRIARPTLAATFQVKVLSGRGLPSFPNGNADCSQDLKVHPQAVLRRALFKELRKEGITGEPITCLGTRYDESQRRALHMALRGENPSEPVANKDGDLVLSPIAYWSTEDVWEFLAFMASSGESYSDFKETMRIYAHAESQSCAIVAETIRDGMAKKKKGGCGARHGCFMCQQATDKSLQNMVEHDERYAYAGGLTRLNRFIRNTRHDWSRRNWVGRTIRSGWIAIQPDTYHPTMLRELFRYMVTLDHDEVVRAREAGEAPRFQILTEEMIIAVDAYWSLGGLANPFAALSDYWDICMNGVRYDIPDVELVPDTPLPDARFVHVGEDWDALYAGSNMTGLRDAYMEALTEDSPCSPDLRELKDGRMVWDTETTLSFSVNPESVAMIWEFELEGLARMHRQGYGSLPGGITAGYKWYLLYGAVTLSYGQVAEHDAALRRSAFKHRLGLSLEYDIQDLLDKSVSYANLPDDETRLAWKHKATTESAQPDLLEASALCG